MQPISLTSPDEECYPPAEFFISSMIIFPNNALIPSSSFNNKPRFDFNRSPRSTLAVIAERPGKNLPCPTCWRLHKKFLCVDCVLRQGRFHEKQRKLEHLVDLKKQLLCEIQQIYSRHISSASDVWASIWTHRQNICAKKLNLAVRTENCIVKLAARRCESVKLALMKESLQKRRQMFEAALNQHRMKKDTMRIRAELSAIRRRLVAARLRMSYELFCRIFTLESFEKFSPTPEISTSIKLSGPGAHNEQDTSICIRQALEAALIEDLPNVILSKYVTTKPKKPVTLQFRIIKSCLVDDSSEYVSLKSWFLEQRSDSPIVDSSCAGAPATGTLAGLCYLAQLVELFARIFDVHLPFARPAGRALRPWAFYAERLDRNEFFTLILKMNARVAVFCFSQGLPLAQVDFQRPFWNMRNFAASLGPPPRPATLGHDWSHGRPIALPRQCLRAFASELQAVTWREPTGRQPFWRDDDAAAASSFSGNADGADDEWETVSDKLPPYDDAAHHGAVATAAGSFDARQDASASLTRIFTSATTSVVNLFRNVHGL